VEWDGRNVYLLYVAAGALLKQNRLQDSLSKFDRLLLQEQIMLRRLRAQLRIAGVEAI